MKIQQIKKKTRSPFALWRNILVWVMIFTIPFLLLSWFGSALLYHDCFQESSNVSNACGGVSTGTYWRWAPGDVFTNPNGMFDNIWNDSGSYADAGRTSHMYANYTIPVLSRGNPIKIQYSNGFFGLGLTNNTLSIPSICLNNTDTLVLRYVSRNPGVSMFDLYCQNTTDTSGTGAQEPIITSAAGPVIGDEAMIWNMSDHLENLQTYNATTYETYTNAFSLNVTYDSYSFVGIDANLFYNNTKYSSTKICSGNDCLFTTTVTAPLIGAMKNFTFYWDIELTNASAVTYYNSTFYNQTVSNITLTKCTTGDITLNFTFYDEQNLTKLNASSFDATFNYYSGSGSIFKTLSITNVSTAEVDICINVDVELYIDSIIAYSREGYPTRNWFSQKYPIGNYTQKKSLLLLQEADSTSFILQVQDRNLQPIQKILVDAQRCYPGINTNMTSFIHRTDNNGLTTGNFEAETALYQFFITSNNSLILAVTPCAKIVPQTTPYTLIFQVGETYISPFSNVNNVSDIVSNLTYNYQTNVLSWYYADSSGDFVSAQLWVTSINNSGNNAVTFCQQNNTLNTGLMTCNMNVSGTYSVRAYVYRTSQRIIDQIVINVSTAVTTYGYYGAFLGFFILLILGFAFKFSEIAGMWLEWAGVVFCQIVGLISFGWTFVTAMLAIVIVLTGVLER